MGSVSLQFLREMLFFFFSLFFSHRHLGRHGPLVSYSTLVDPNFAYQVYIGKMEYLLSYTGPTFLVSSEGWRSHLLGSEPEFIGVQSRYASHYSSVSSFLFNLSLYIGELMLIVLTTQSLDLPRADLFS